MLPQHTQVLMLPGYTWGEFFPGHILGLILPRQE